MPQPTVGYGKFYYGGGLYGQMQIASGQMSSTWTASGTRTGSLRAHGAEAAAHTWTWSSTAVAHPIDAGRVSSGATWTSARIGSLRAHAAHGSAWTWSSTINRSAQIATYHASCTWTSHAQGALIAGPHIAEFWLWTSSIIGHLFWEPVPPDVPVVWTPSNPGVDPWTPVTPGTDPWTPVKEYD